MWKFPGWCFDSCCGALCAQRDTVSAETMLDTSLQGSEFSFTARRIKLREKLEKAQKREP